MAGNCIMFLLLKMISKTHLSIPYCRSFPIHEHLGRERGEIEGRVPLWEKSTEAQCLFKTKFLVAVVVVMAAATARRRCLLAAVTTITNAIIFAAAAATVARAICHVGIEAM